MYSNFEAFLSNSETELKWNDESGKKCIGRPPKADHHPDKENKLVWIPRDPAKPFQKDNKVQASIKSHLGKRTHDSCQIDEADKAFQIKTIKLEFGRN